MRKHRIEVSSPLGRPVMVTTIYQLSPRQIEVLRYGAQGNAWEVPGSRTGGAIARMISGLVKQSLLTDTFPRKTTEQGDRVIAAYDAQQKKG